MALRGTDPESHVTEYTLVHKDELLQNDFTNTFCETRNQACAGGPHNAQAQAQAPAHSRLQDTPF